MLLLGTVSCDWVFRGSSQRGHTIEFWIFLCNSYRYSSSPQSLHIHGGITKTEVRSLTKLSREGRKNQTPDRLLIFSECDHRSRTVRAPGQMQEGERAGRERRRSEGRPRRIPRNLLRNWLFCVCNTLYCLWNELLRKLGTLSTVSANKRQELSSSEDLTTAFRRTSIKQAPNPFSSSGVFRTPKPLTEENSSLRTNITRGSEER